MRGFVGFLVLSTGLSVGAYSYNPSLLGNLPSPSSWLAGEPRISLATVQPASAQASGVADAGRVRVFSPQSPLFAPAVNAEPQRPVAPVRTADAQPAPASPAGAAVAPEPASNGVVVTVTETQAQPITRPVSDWAATVTRNAIAKGGPNRSKPADPDARADLVRDIQTQLKRVGCYEGEIDGSWGPGSKRAMSAFTERINATLPVDEPDYILLTLVQGHRTAACGEQCPTGQALSDGRCVPRAVIAAAARKARGEAAVAVAEPAAPAIAAVKSKPDAAASEPGAQVAARIEAPAPVAAAAPVAKAPVRTVAETIRDDSARAAATPAEVKPAATAEAKPAVAARVIARAEEIPAKPEAKHVAKQLVAKPAIRTAAVEANVEPAREPLPGRMTIGGPVPERTKAEEPVTSSTTVDDDDAPKAAAVRKPHQAVHAPKPVHAPRAANHPAPRVVHTPAPPSRQHVAPPRPRYVAPAPSSGGGGAAARQRALVYNLFQRPDRF